MLFRRSEEHTSELQSHDNLVCRLLLEKKTKELAAHSVSQPSHHSPQAPRHRAGAARGRAGGAPAARGQGPGVYAGVWIFFLMIRRPPRAPRFPYTTLLSS